MRIITRTRLREFAQRFPDAAQPLRLLERTLKAASWQNLQDVRRVYPHADPVEVASGNSVTVVNVGGNKYRLVVAIHFNRQRDYVLRMFRHSEYSKGRWKSDL